MSDSERTITVAIDLAAHGGRQPESEAQRIVWETLDTAWKLLREGAVRVTLARIREANPELPADEELFRMARESGDPAAPSGYLDLAPDRGDGPAVEVAGMGLQGAFQVLGEQAMADAIEGLGIVVEGEFDADHA